MCAGSSERGGVQKAWLAEGNDANGCGKWFCLWSFRPPLFPCLLPARLLKCVYPVHVPLSLQPCLQACGTYGTLSCVGFQAPPVSFLASTPATPSLPSGPGQAADGGEGGARGALMRAVSRSEQKVSLRRCRRLQKASLKKCSR